jgi:hypothetical protein
MMDIRLRHLEVVTTSTKEQFSFEPLAVFLHGPIGAGKSSVARLIDYCFGGRIERTVAIQRHFIAVRLRLHIRGFTVEIERGAEDAGSVRVTWSSETGASGAINAPFDAQPGPIHGDNVYNLSDLIFWFSGVEPIKVRKSKRDPDSSLVRLSFRDVLWYCYLPQDRLDNSFFRLEDPNKKYKSFDAMRYFVSLHSERLSILDEDLVSLLHKQRTDRETVLQLRKFLSEFEIESEIEQAAQILVTRNELAAARVDREQITAGRVAGHVTDALRSELRSLSERLAAQREAVEDTRARIAAQEALKAELLTAKLKASRSSVASTMLKGVAYKQCPCCATVLDASRFASTEQCGLCGAPTEAQPDNSLEYEALQRDLNQRMDELGESIERHRAALRRNERRHAEMLAVKESKDRELSDEVKSYDSAQLAALRGADRRVAALEERVVHLQRLAAMPKAIDNLERSAGALQGEIDRLRTEIRAERARMSGADRNIAAIADEFLEILLRVKYPGVSASDSVVLDTRTWMPEVVNGQDIEVRWSFLDAGSGGKKTLFNVCYALALHRVALVRDFPMPPFLIVDSPTKNLGKDINKEIVARMIQELYSTVVSAKGQFQVLLIDSDYIPPDPSLDIEVSDRLMVPGDPEHPPLISFYEGP